MSTQTKFDITMIGHVSKDIMIYADQEERLTGGAVVYSSVAAARSGKRVHVVTAAAPDDDGELDHLRREGVVVTRVDSPETTSIRNVYLSEDRERRTATLLSRARSFREADVPAEPSRIYHLAGLFRDEIPDSLIPFLAAKGPVGIDAQGLLRCSEEGELLFRPWDGAETYLPHVTYLKTDAAEAEIMTGTTDRRKAARILADYGAREVMVTHNEGVLVFADGEVHLAPYNPANLSGRTGRGDTTFAAYMVKRLDASVRESTYYAAALCSIKMETPGPFSGTPEDVYRRMKQIGY